jgi:hypothetical protein
LVESGEDHGFDVGVELVWCSGDATGHFRSAGRSATTTWLPFARFPYFRIFRRAHIRHKSRIVEC